MKGDQQQIQKRIATLTRRLRLGTDHRARLLTSSEVYDIEVERAKLTHELEQIDNQEIN